MKFYPSSTLFDNYIFNHAPLIYILKNLTKKFLPSLFFRAKVVSIISNQRLSHLEEEEKQKRKKWGKKRVLRDLEKKSLIYS